MSSRHKFDFLADIGYNSSWVMTVKQEIKEQCARQIRDFRLPRYNEIPNVGLYLDQVAKYISEYLTPLGESPLTASMISNYVKKHLIDSPVKKQYSREQIAYLFFIAVAKSILSLEALGNFIQVQKQSYPLPVAYDYFCRQLEVLLQFTFELTDTMDVVGEDVSDEKRLFYSCIAAVAQKIYLEKILEAVAAQKSE